MKILNIASGPAALQFPVERKNDDPEVNLKSGDNSVNDDVYNWFKTGYAAVDNEDDGLNGRDHVDDYEDDREDQPDENKDRIPLLHAQQQQDVDYNHYDCGDNSSDDELGEGSQELQNAKDNIDNSENETTSGQIIAKATSVYTAHLGSVVNLN